MTMLQSESAEVERDLRDYRTNLVSEFRGFWDVQLKATNYLLIAHAAGLVTCVTQLKDYTVTTPLKGIGVFVWLFGSGLSVAIVAFALLVSQRPLLFVSHATPKRFWQWWPSGCASPLDF
jgi:hypothetical protein